MPRESTRTARLEARVSPEVLAVLRHAAELQGRSLSDFVVSVAQDAAHRAIKEASVIHLSDQDQRQFAELLLNPPEPTDALKRAVEAHQRLIGPV
ncbi:type II toxin-antitoxin system TacA family antitoxin [Imhoffiella purpurea]|uniref:type II toxin-antitoxin system TacA family antitoxin n=1 Tax=Imhoffiella purpurea TaxID=1249627 RepID=UPI0009DD5004|nr:DUF1778 domain-containing protein [Imhoffiella purpurea]